MGLNVEPRRDGDVNTYRHPVARTTSYWNGRGNVLFINGMANDGASHMEAAMALSQGQMCQVTGVYNQGQSLVADLVQCLADKNQWDGPLGGAERGFNEARTAFHRLFGNRQAAIAGIESALDRNPPAVSMLREILRRRGPIRIFAHSQGNLILSNVLKGLEILDGRRALSRITVYSYGSPTLNWPAGITRHEYAFTFDPVTWLSRVAPTPQQAGERGWEWLTESTSVGLPSNADALGIISHSFLSYLADDATFVVNQFRWGALGMTLNLDEAGLAEALVRMGTNVPRIRAVVQHLWSAHWSDVDDVVVIYVRRIRNNSRILQAVRGDSVLRDLLIRALDEGPTWPDEYAMLAVLRD